MLSYEIDKNVFVFFKNCTFKCIVVLGVNLGLSP